MLRGNIVVYGLLVLAAWGNGATLSANDSAKDFFDLDRSFGLNEENVKDIPLPPGVTCGSEQDKMIFLDYFRQFLKDPGFLLKNISRQDAAWVLSPDLDRYWDQLPSTYKHKFAEEKKRFATIIDRLDILVESDVWGDNPQKRREIFYSLLSDDADNYYIFYQWFMALSADKQSKLIPYYCLVLNSGKFSPYAAPIITGWLRSVSGLLAQADRKSNIQIMITLDCCVDLNVKYPQLLGAMSEPELQTLSKSLDQYDCFFEDQLQIYIQYLLDARNRSSLEAFETVRNTWQKAVEADPALAEPGGLRGLRTVYYDAMYHHPELRAKYPNIVKNLPDGVIYFPSAVWMLESSISPPRWPADDQKK